MMSPRRDGTNMDKCEEGSQTHSLVQNIPAFLGSYVNEEHCVLYAMD